MAALIRFATPPPHPGRDVSLADLIVAAWLAVGTILTTRRHGVTLRAVVVFDGIVVNRHWYAHPSSPIPVHTGAATANGWYDWKLPDGRRLAKVRNEYRRVQ